MWCLTGVWTRQAWCIGGNQAHRLPRTQLLLQFEYNFSCVSASERLRPIFLALDSYRLLKLSLPKKSTTKHHFTAILGYSPSLTST